MSVARAWSREALARRLHSDVWPARVAGRLVARHRSQLRAGLALGLLALVAYTEVRTAAVQSRLLSGWAARLSWEVQPGPSPRLVLPHGGPWDAERGYSRLGEFQRRLQAAGYRVVAQARQSEALARALEWGITPPYPEPAAIGLVVHDARGLALFDAQPRHTVFGTLDDVPPLVVRTLLFLENRELARTAGNPAVDWLRLARAGGLYLARQLGAPVRVEGGSTLAVQIEKYRHSEGGRTGGPLDKLRQLTAASLRVYRAGPDSREAWKEIVLDYLNTMPLAAAPGWGEVRGLGEGLRVWFGLDPDAVRQALAAPDATLAKARAYRHVLALLLAVRAPTRYLVQDRPALERRVAFSADRLAEAGVLDPDLRRALPAEPLHFREPSAGGPASFSDRRADLAVREHVRSLLGLPGLYEVDRLHLEVDSTVDGRLQRTTTRLLHDLTDPAFVAAHGLRAPRLLAAGDPRRVVYSVLLLERTARGDVLRVIADNVGRPFDLNAGMKLELGSTAKLRTLAHYLDVAAALHRELSALERPALDRWLNGARDPISRWAAQTLQREPALPLEVFLERALERTYSAHPGEVFFTGGGAHTFENFDAGDDRRVLSVREALVRSTNLVFVRLMRDLVRYHAARLPYDASAVLADADHPERTSMLEAAAEAEAVQHLRRAWRAYRGLDPAGTLRRLLGARADSPRDLAIVFFAWHPGGDAGALQAWLAAHDHPVTPEEAARLTRAFGNPRLTLVDHGYLLGRHPLEVWCAGEVSRNPAVTWEELLARSAEARRQASAWLFRSRHRPAQERRLRVRIEQDAFARMTAEWQRLGFPFAHLVPSYATALGASGDRPAALAELMGIILNDGVRRPAQLVPRLRFAPGTPYHTVFEAEPERGERVLPAAVARALRRVLAEAVERGTARRAAGAFRRLDGTPAVIGGKTGSGDNRYETFAGPGHRLASRPVSRTAAFVFYVDDRYFGVITASVTGPAAGGYEFTSALPLTVLRLLGAEFGAL